MNGLLLSGGQKSRGHSDISGAALGNIGEGWCFRLGIGIEWKPRSDALGARSWSDSPALAAKQGQPHIELCNG
jgi:hypothetical protein